MSGERLTTLALLLLVLGLAYYLYLDEPDAPLSASPSQELPIFSGEQLRNTSYDSMGVRNYQITAQNLAHYASSGDTEFQQPTLSIFHDGATEEWRVSAKRAVLDDAQQLTLYDNVQMQNLLPDAGFTTMVTEVLVIDLTTRDFHADQPVMLIGPLFETRAQAMKGNLRANHATLYDNVQGRYEVDTP
ncbi:LPS export ABC transporter periplasmic protein LptC [Vibrio sp. SM6]|uniref:Lipopolysaccharide export system protein LptC n=1 Tax=Vibrio agarilyticus TaxID=2726741 RepID=A0A7X8TP80_9VIBR|nr:LPS export ABC transporter periplasmic protein LptC [Vibrio agarilyticus]NLS12402.1 LPS export ABC transporter periplasmic protein LptC [Vibrio agarilyticus]